MWTGNKVKSYLRRPLFRVALSCMFYAKAVNKFTHHKGVRAHNLDIG